MSTSRGILGLILLALALEIWALANAVPGDTISEITWGVAFNYPMIPFAVGFVMGHLFWPSTRMKDVIEVHRKDRP